ncbi:hypothetical protein [Pseudomonas putida]|uniref:hypothetical protein n=1 Tax=Pseudomonas putida TaxID=303 RepID=UPI001CD35449|nr:hypothetical protein [Pseudomonas putida]
MSNRDESRNNYIQALLAQARSKLNSNEASERYSASWLAEGGLGSAQWRVRAPKRKELVTIVFNRHMPDGTKLCDEENRLLLETIQKSAFHLRMGSLTERFMGHNQWMSHIYFLINFAAWLILHKSVYEPQLYGFRQLSKNSCEVLLAELGAGSWPEALQYKQRLVLHFYSCVNSLFPIDYLLLSVDELPKDFIGEVVHYLESQDLYSPSVGVCNDGNVMVSRKYLASILGAHVSGFRSLNLRAFLRQFEPDLQHPSILLSATRTTRYFSQNTHLVEQANSPSIGKSYFKTFVSLLLNFLKSHKKIPLDVPGITLDAKSLLNGGIPSLKPKGHTKLIPLTIGLMAIDKALEWVLVFGDAIVSSVSFYVDEFLKLDRKYSASCSAHYKQRFFEKTQHLWMTKAFPGLPSRRLDEALNIISLQTKKPSTFPQHLNHYRGVVHIFVGACALIIAMLKPIRDKELTSVKRDCLSIDTALGGAFIEHENGKAGVLGVNPMIDRPIPSVVARAIQLLQVMGEQLSALYGDESDHKNDLFYLFGPGFKIPSGKCQSQKVNSCLDLFCEAIGMPKDKHGRSWYIRIHEMRKFFMLTLNRHEISDTHDLLAYAAGHFGREHVYEYVDYHISDSEVVRYEAECVDDKLIAFEAGQLAPDDNQGLVAVHQSVLKRFKVSSVSTIPQEEFMDYLSGMLGGDQIEISTYTVRLDDYDGEVLAIDFALRFGEKRDAKFQC